MKHRKLSKAQREYADVYLLSNHWEKLKQQLIYSNASAKCWICEIKRTLLIHHIDYKNLYNERLTKDVYILCYNCHSQAHFWHFLFLFKMKIPLQRKLLLRRLMFLRAKFCIRKGNVILSSWYLARYLFYLH